MPDTRLGCLGNSGACWTMPTASAILPGCEGAMDIDKQLVVGLLRAASEVAMRVGELVTSQ